MITRFLRDEDGATSIEYGLLAALLSVAIIAAVSLLGDALGDLFNTMAERVGDAV